MSYGYAQLPIYHYHTFNRRNLQYTPIPVFIPPPPPPPPLEVPTFPNSDSDNDDTQDGAGDEGAAPDDAPPDLKSGRHDLICLVLSNRAESRHQIPSTNSHLNQDGSEPPDDVPDGADSGDAPAPSDEGKVSAEEAQVNVTPEPTATEKLDGGENPDAALDAPNWSADDQEPKEANFPPIEPVVGSEDDAGHKEPDGADLTVSFSKCADPPTLLLYLFWFILITIDMVGWTKR